MGELASLTLSDARDKMRAGEITSREITEDCLSAIEAAQHLQQGAGVTVGHFNVSTIKPFVDPTIIEALASASHVLVAENHLTSGGLGTAVAETIAEHGFAAKLQRVGITDRFTHGGRPQYLFEHYGLDTAGIVKAAANLLDLDSSLHLATNGVARDDAAPSSDAEGL